MKKKKINIKSLWISCLQNVWLEKYFLIVMVEKMMIDVKELVVKKKEMVVLVT